MNPELWGPIKMPFDPFDYLVGDITKFPKFDRDNPIGSSPRWGEVPRQIHVVSYAFIIIVIVFFFV